LNSDSPLDRQPDAALIARYVAVRDEEAFRELVRRHGPMVLSTCARMLRHRQDAEDAFQAVFVILAARSRSLRRVRSLGGWLHNVAVRVSYGVLRGNRRRSRRLFAAHRDRPSQEERDCVRELHDVLDKELTALPAKYREAIVLCDLEGHTREEAARILNTSASTVGTWVDRGRRRLRDRLVRRGVTVGVGGLAAAWSVPSGAMTQISAHLIQQTLRHAELFVLTGTKVSGTAAAAKITSLAQGELNNMFLTKLSTTVGIVALALALVLGASPAVNIIGFGTGARAATIFFDDFEDGNVTDGDPVTWLFGRTNGTRQIVSGDYVLSGSDVSSYADGSISFRDGSIRTQLRFLQSNDSSIAYVFSRSPTFGPSYVGAIRRDGLLAIIESFDADPFIQIHSETPTSLDPVTRDVVLQLDAFGNRISLFAWHAGDPKPNQPQLVVFDDTLTFGDVGIGMDFDARVGAGGQSQVAFRHFAAVPEPNTIALGSLGSVALASFTFRNRLLRVSSAR
jgi:RNA polymerase sigma factor (sigma-70 family)